MTKRPQARDNNTFIRDIHRLIRHARSGALSTTSRGRESWPYASLVAVASDMDGSPLFLFSDLSDHTQNLMKNAKAAFLIEEGSRKLNPQRGARVTLQGIVEKTDDPSHRRRFLARHPEASMYAGFGDFNFFRMTVERVHYVGGFAKAQWVKPAEIALDPEMVADMTAAEESVIEHMNDDHADAVQLYATNLLKRKGDGWFLAGVDPLGLDLMRGNKFARLDFDEPLTDASQLRHILVQLAGDARNMSN